MTILKKLFKPKNASEASPKPITLHPMARQAWGDVLAAWAKGAVIEALNPQGKWVVVDNPVFEPDVEYRIFGTNGLSTDGLSANASPTGRSKAQPELPKVPMPPQPVMASSPFKVGKVYTSQDGRNYLVVANKRELFSNYDIARDPDHSTLVVVRWDKGMKKSVAHRHMDGCGKTVGANLRLTTERDVSETRETETIIRPSSVFRKDGSYYVQVAERKDADIVIHPESFETRIFQK